MASSSKPKRIYHVFLSFRGEDVHNNFLGHLYGALDQEGIYTYVDSEEFRKKEQIVPALMKVIEESHIAIIIFSEDYASSWWCLEEVAKIMDCKEERDLMVFPVFYKVESREVRTPREKYKEAMFKHETKFGKDSEEVKRWKKALSDASSLSGWHLEDGDELELIQGLVTEISTHLDRTPLHVAKYPVGIDSQVIMLKSMLNLESNDDVLMMGLWGKGGVGKTTLAKAIYNDIFRQFGNSCFLVNVREASKDCKDLVTLQEKLLFEILALKERLAVPSVDRGINQIQDRLYHKKVLLILDDVDDLRQLNALAGEGKWFGNGSRIIITTRNKHLLTCHGIDLDHVYEVKELDDGAAHELLSKHAFLTHQKLKVKTNIVNSVLNYAKGLPLALEVLGSFLRGRREAEWESTLDKISMAPKKDIYDVLKISYDGLEENEKEIFLHIVCFFKGRHSEYIKKVLDSCDFEATIGLEILIERSLISIEGHGFLKVHDLIQGMGREIVNQECRDNPKRRSRLWLFDDVVNILSCDMGDCAVEAIVLEQPELTEMHIGLDAFMKMRRLRLLILHNVHNSFQGSICLPHELRWFEWPELAQPIPKFSSGQKKLVGLNMNKGNFTRVVRQFKDFQQLKYINFSNCESLVAVPDLSYTPNLEELFLSNCKNLIEAHESIAYHDKLQILNLRGCSSLSVFPYVLKSKNLQVLNFEKCKKFERFPNIPHELIGLKELYLQGTAIKALPTSIENLVSLKEMHLNDCKNLQSVPSNIYRLQNVEFLGLMGCTDLIEFPKYENLADPCMKTGLSNLIWLDLRGCNLSEVDFIENLSCFPFLSELLLDGNNIISLPTSINKRDHLSVLKVTNCHQLQEIPELPPFLKHLWAENCESLQKNGGLTSSDDFVRRGLSMAHISTLRQVPLDFTITLPGGEMPKWIVPVEEGFISFMVSKDFYDKFLGLALCVILGNDGLTREMPLQIVPQVNGEGRYCDEWYTPHVDSDHIWLQYVMPYDLWGEVDFGQFGGSDVHFGLAILSENVKSWGFRIICKQLGDNLKIVLQDDQLIDPNLLYEVADKTYSEDESSFMHKDSLIETGLQKDLPDCQISTEKHSQIASKRNHELILTQGMRTKTMLALNSFQSPIHLPNKIWWPRCAPSILEFFPGPKKLVGLHTTKDRITVVPTQFKQGDGDEDDDMAEIVDMFLKKDGDSEEVEREVAKLEEKRQVASIKKNVGTDDQVHQITCLMDIDDKDKQILVVIHGEDGIGKTTLAKLVYNQVSCDFDGCSFLADIEEATQVSGGLKLLQAKLISDVLKRELEDVAFVNKGIEFFRDLLYDMRVLIILDDVENESHVQKLIRDCFDCFASGSRIIVTTRNSVILEECPQIRTYHVSCLDNYQALQLFRQNAPMHTSSSHSNFKLSNNALNAMAGLPLFIEVMAAVFNGKTREEWNNLVKQLLKRRDFQSILEEALDYQQKQRFLDIACFTTGIDSRIALYLWDVSPFPPFSEILTPLAKIGENNQIWMHRMLRQLGREIVRGENLTDPGMQSRLFNHEIALDTIKRKKGTKKVEALCLNFQWHTSDKLTPEDFQSMPNLRFLQLDYADIAGDFAEVFLKLRWLRWRGCPQHLQVTNFHLGNLTILDLSWSKVTKDWKAWDQIKMQNLRVLDLTGCADLLVTPKFSGCQNLAILILERCSQLVKIDHSISKLLHLVSLNLKFCTELSMLPVELGHLTALKELLMDGTSVQEIPISIGHLKQLETLSASNCFSLNMLPRTIRHLTNISLLSLDGTGITAIPDSIRELGRLKNLSLRDCHQIITLPNSIGNMGRSLVELDVSGTGASEFPNSIKNLQNLKVLRMDSCFFREFPVDIGELTSLEEIHASWCRSLEGGIPSEIKKLHNLRILRLRHSSISSIPAEIYQLSNLRTLDLLHCDMIKKLPRLPSSITVLYVDDELKSSHLP